MNLILLSRCLILFYIHFKINLPFHSFATKGYVSEFIWKSFCSPNLSVISLYQKRWITCVLLLNINCLLLNRHRCFLRIENLFIFKLSHYEYVICIYDSMNDKSNCKNVSKKLISSCVKELCNHGSVFYLNMYLS